jgi:hypothetical protein
VAGNQELGETTEVRMSDDMGLGTCSLLSRKTDIRYVGKPPGGLICDVSYRSHGGRSVRIRFLKLGGEKLAARNLFAVVEADQVRLPRRSRKARDLILSRYVGSRGES